MPLSDPAPREHLHTRRIEVSGFRREDGLWDLDAHLVDTKTYGFDNRHRGRVEAGEPVHEMHARLTIDEQLEIHAAQACTEHGPYGICGDITPRFGLLAGLTIGPGWMREAARRFGGVKGCTHLFELLRPMATTAFQTLVAARASKPRDPSRPPRWLDTCHAHARDGVVVKEMWPDFYTGTR